MLFLVEVNIGKLAVTDYSELIVAEVVVWLSRLVATEVLSQNSIVIYGLAIVHLYIVSQFIIWALML